MVQGKQGGMDHKSMFEAFFKKQTQDYNENTEEIQA